MGMHVTGNMSTRLSPPTARRSFNLCVIKKGIDREWGLSIRHIHISVVVNVPAAFPGEPSAHPHTNTKLLRLLGSMLEPLAQSRARRCDVTTNRLICELNASPASPYVHRQVRGQRRVLIRFVFGSYLVAIWPSGPEQRCLWHTTRLLWGRSGCSWG